MPAPINIHAIIPCSRVNGPAERMVVFFQGCARSCPGCFNPQTHSFEPRELMSVEGIMAHLPAAPVEGITVSGGEPFMQAEGLAALLAEAVRRGLGTVVYTGFRMEELGGEAACSCLSLIDVLVDGAYDEARPETTLLARGSANQRFHFLTGRYGVEDFIMPGKVEITIAANGAVTETGFSQISLSGD